MHGSVTDNLRILQAPIRSLNGVGPKRAEQLENFGIARIEDLLYHLPFRYEDRRQILKLRDAVIGADGTFVGQITAVRSRYIPQRRTQVLKALLRDETGAIDLVWYRAPSYIVKSLANANTLMVHGKVEIAPSRQKRIVHPEFEVLATPEHIPSNRIMPIYLRPGGLPLSVLSTLVSDALREYGRRIPSCLPRSILNRQGLVPLEAALKLLHEVPVDSDVDSLNSFSSVAHKSIVFDEFFYLQLGLALRKQQRLGRGKKPMNTARDLTSRMISLLSFRLTAAQERALSEITSDLRSGRPMQRLLQGDVGCGKTMVAWFASLRVIEQGAQAIWMTPTELLAEQHYRGLKPFADDLKLESALLTASTPAQQKKSLLQRIQRGEIPFVVGTHALIQQDVSAPRMGMGVVDEQHRFGVLQRFSLQRLTSGGGAIAALEEPHMLLMSATPIPRSLAMVLYGDMDVSFIDEMPPGRTPIATKVFRDSDRRTVYEGVLRELRRGRQVFIVYPLVETSEQLDHVRDASQMAEKMRSGAFKDYGVGLLHGRMSAQERDEIMRSLRDGKIGVLVATTVIEVGIDIPNATLIVIEHADRFGLSQLHQLRGRVGRGSAPASCFLIDRSSGKALASKRLRIMEREQSGFKIAEADLALRGPGEFLGTQQSGMPGFRLANLLRDSELLMEARKEALEWLDKDPELGSHESGYLRAVLQHRWGQRLQLGAVV